MILVATNANRLMVKSEEKCIIISRGYIEGTNIWGGEMERLHREGLNLQNQYQPIFKNLMPIELQFWWQTAMVLKLTIQTQYYHRENSRSLEGCMEKSRGTNAGKKSCIFDHKPTISKTHVLKKWPLATFILCWKF